MAKSDKAVKEKQEQQNNVAQADSKKQVQSVEFAEAAENETAGPGGSIDILLDMDVPVTVAIGQTEISVRRLLQLVPGSVLKLGKPIDEPVELYLRDTKFAAGSVVVVDGRFAVKIKQILSVGDSDARTASGEKKS
ncbi:MAG: FliM/FliN family flagellar motor switch protein [Planctomycetota bacterium]|nr:FliM/FliN family flagellar motor switch protein [Planctomycetota bacterium]